MDRFNIFATGFEYDDDDPEGYRAGMSRFGRGIGGQQMGATVYEVPAGQSICPYHYEAGEEEWLTVLSGRPTVRHPDGEEVLEPGDTVCFPSGPAGAHKVTNDTDEPVRVLMISTLREPAVSVYPDSGKVGVSNGHGEFLGRFRLEDGKVDYYDREV
jgi:uncharacterized cupin superfamily protein